MNRLLTPVGILIAAIVVSAPVLAFVMLSSANRDARAESPDTAVLRQESGNFLYTYHLPTGTEALFDTEADPRLLVNLAPDRPDLARKLRKMLLRRLRVRTLEELRAPHEEMTERLRGLGYL